LIAFAKVVECGSLSRAAAELAIPRPTIGRRLAMLEQHAGKRLLRRTTRSQTLTDEGRALYPHARAIVEAIGRAEAALASTSSGELRGAVRVSVPSEMPRGFSALVSDFMTRYPEVRLHVHCSNRVIDLRRDDYDVALRATKALEPGIVARTLFRDELWAVAAPAYLETHGTPRNRRELTQHRVLGDIGGNERAQISWPAGRKGSFHVDPVLCANSREILLDAALRGLGITVLPRMQVRAAIDDGKLEHVLKDAIKGEMRVVIAFAERDFIPAQVRAFGDELTKWALGELVSRGQPRR
jgi:DNA-binding transcriptional LysR family regulator